MSYEKPSMDIVYFSVFDVICTSITGNDKGSVDDLPGHDAGGDF